MSLPALHTLSIAPARHLIACERVADQALWHEHPVLALLQRCQITTRWLLARYVLSSPDMPMAGTRTGIARRLCAEVCAELDAEESVLEPELGSVRRPATTGDNADHRRSALRRMVERVMDVRPDTRLFDARVLALGKLFERHLQQTMRRAAGVVHLPLSLKLGERLSMRHDEVLLGLASGETAAAS